MRSVQLVLVAALLSGCGSSPARPTQVSSVPPSVVTVAAASMTSVSPEAAAAGSTDLTITVTGANFVARSPVFTWVRWRANGRTADLTTTVTSSTRLTAAIPAQLLRDGAMARLELVTSDPRAAANGGNEPMSDFLPFVVIPLTGIWTGSMTDAVGTADAILTLAAEGPSTLAYQYAGTPASSDTFNVTDAGAVTIDAVDEGNVLSFTFASPKKGGVPCWVGHFQGTFMVTAPGRHSFSGRYELAGGSEACFSPPRTGTFSFAREG
jgi:hypothetical protein